MLVDGIIDRLARADWGSQFYRLLPARGLDTLANLPLRGMDEGHGGIIRGWGLDGGTLRGRVSRDPLYRKARRAAKGRSVVSELRRLNLFLLIRFYFSDLASQDIAELGVYRGG